MDWDSEFKRQLLKPTSTISPNSNQLKQAIISLDAALLMLLIRLLGGKGQDHTTSQGNYQACCRQHKSSLGHPSHGPVGGRLGMFWDNWIIPQGPFVTNIPRHGYQFSLTADPPLTSYHPNFRLNTILPSSISVTWIVLPTFIYVETAQDQNQCQQSRPPGSLSSCAHPPQLQEFLN